jgi:thymidylate synthase
MEIKINDMQLGYLEVLSTVFAHGAESKPRGKETCELLNTTVTLTDPHRSLPVNIGRDVNTKIAAVEALQLLGGVLHPERMLQASGAFSEFMDGGTFHGGYGQRTRAQLPTAVQRLRDDPESRRALITMWDPLHDLFVEDARDYPCTIALQFLVRDGHLLLHTHMRSNDAWRGLTYDVFVFTQLQLAVAAVLNLPVGEYTHHTTSLHIYESDFDAAWRLLRRTHRGILPLRVESLVRPGVSMELTMEIARMILARDPWVPRGEVHPEMLAWYRERV